MRKITNCLRTFINIQYNKLNFYYSKDMQSEKVSLDNDIILIGPPGVGKSTASKLIGKELNLPVIHLDDERWKYFRELGYRTSKQKRLEKKGDFKRVYKYWKPFEAYTVKRVTEKYRKCVLDFGGGFSVYTSRRHFEIVQNSLRNYKNIFLLLPTEDNNENLEIINSRRGKSREINEHLLNNSCNKKLATHIIYANGRSPEEICKEIINIFRENEKQEEVYNKKPIEFFGL